MLPVTVIGGYLGAGKTTLVNHLLRHADGLRIAVLVNEFGALPIDADLIEAQDDALISIAGGCVCCSYGNDLIAAMMELSKLPQAPEHILIESSGVALPGAIAASVGLLEGFAIDGIVVLADAETIREQAVNDYIGDTIERQLADADLVVLNKSDLPHAAELEAVQGWLPTMSPGAAIVPASHAEVPNAVILQSFAQSLKPIAAPHRLAFDSRVLRFDQHCDAEVVARALADPDHQLVRAKGFVPTAQGMRAVQVMGRRWAVSDAPEGVKPGVVIIAQPAQSDLDAVADKIAQIARA